MAQISSAHCKLLPVFLSDRAKDMLHTPHYRDRIRETIFGESEFASLFRSFEGGALIMWRWSSLVQTARSLKKRAGPLRMMWSMEKYLASASAVEDNAGNGGNAFKTTATQTLKLFDQAIQDPFFWSYLVPWIPWTWTPNYSDGNSCA